ncbi:MAG: hypothetical protein JOZ15_01105 [Acidobacteria bacterium]|nr:hypothetical protein [Acidobacteriota bacterium]
MRGIHLARRLRPAAGAAAVAAAAAALLSAAVPVRAETSAREEAAAAMRARLGPAPGPVADREAVLRAWEAAGAHLDPVRRHLAEHRGPGAIDGAALLFGDLCGPDLALPRDVPDPGDLLLYLEPAAAGGRWRVGMFTGAALAVILAPQSHRLVEVPRGLLLDEVSQDPGPRLASAGTLRTCRVSAAVVPVGAGRPAAGSGRRRVSLVDAREAVRGLQWEFDHPRDADTGAGHRLAHLVAVPLALVSGAVATVLGGAGRITGALLDAAGPAPAVWASHLLGISFDGRAAHAVLTEIATWLMVGPGPLLLAHVSATAAAALRPVHAVASFAVSLLTGVDDSRHVLAGGVILALACDLLVVARPLALAGRLGARAADGLAAIGPGGAALHRTLDLSSRAGDLVSGRPSSLLRLAGTTPPRGVHDVLDAASLLLRPSSLPGHLVELSGRLARWGRTADAASTSAPPSARALAAALHHLGAERLHHVERLAELSHLNSGSRTLTAAAFGQLHPFSADSAPKPTSIHLAPVDQEPIRW